MMMETIPIENGQQVSILVTSSISILIAIVSVGLRLVAKSIGNRIDYSDYCIIAALVGQTSHKEITSVLTCLPAMKHCTARLLHLTSYTWRLWIPYHGDLPTLWA
jgi:hypothetical protein